jgi:hypothetical protein
MPERETTEKAKEDLREGKSPSTAAGEFVHEEIEHVREGKHGARSPQQAIAIGLSKARRAGVPLAAPAKGKTKESTRRGAERDLQKGHSGQDKEPSARASRARQDVLKREPRSSASKRSLSSQAHSASERRSASDRKQAADKAVRTKGKAELREAGQKAARTRSGKSAES